MAKSKRYLDPSQYGLSASFHTADHSVKLFAPLILMTSDSLRYPGTPQCSFQGFPLFIPYFSPEWVTPKVLATTSDLESKFLVYTSLLNKPVNQIPMKCLGSHTPDKSEC